MQFGFYSENLWAVIGYLPLVSGERALLNSLAGNMGYLFGRRCFVKYIYLFP